MFRITKEFKFELAHMLENHSGKCLNLHGHSYKMLVSVSAAECKGDMVLDFADLKNIVKNTVIDKIDHAFGYYINTSDETEKGIAELLKKSDRLVYGFSSRPTAEKMAEHFYKVLKPALEKNNYRLSNIKLYETDTACAEYSED